MHEYDVALKSILMRPGSALLKTLTGYPSLRWMNVELPQVNNRRVDMLGAAPGGKLMGIEFQSRNEKRFPFRMGEYAFGMARIYGHVPRQIVLYVGEEKMRMRDRIEGPDFSFRFHLVDVRELDGEALLASPNPGDNVIAVLTRLGNERETVRRILKRIADGPAAMREQAVAELMIVAGLRRRDDDVEKEARRMPILNDIMDTKVVGPLLRRGRAEGLAEGQAELILGLMERRFGAVPPEIRERLAGLSPKQLRNAGLRILDAKRPADVFPR